MVAGEREGKGSKEQVMKRDKRWGRGKRDILTQTFIYNSWTKVECAQHISINVHLVTTSSFRFLAGVYADHTAIDGVGTLLTSVERKRIYNPTAQLVPNVPSHFHSCFNSQYGSVTL